MRSTQLRIAVSLTAESSVYQQAEARAAQATAQRTGFQVSITYAQGDAIRQSDHLLTLIHSAPEIRPDVIMLEPVGTGMVRVAREAARIGIGWIVLNREVEYIPEMRASGTVPVFAVTTNHIETGRIQGRQLNALLPNGGSVIYLEGPTGHPVVQARCKGMLEAKDPRIKIRTLHAAWQESVASDVLSSWMRLPNWQELCPHVVAAQNDFMAKGARTAFDQCTTQTKSETVARTSFIGCDGLEEHGQRWVKEGLLDATIVCPSLTSLALETLAKQVEDEVVPPPLILAQPTSLPALRQLRPVNNLVTTQAH
ncbi:MAG TPA: substrate-binding domain-containing protein [Dongiaceae bacterium]|nr:substrate-binding domain-containing protein [Dongiaceae bacterium]